MKNPNIQLSTYGILQHELYTFMQINIPSFHEMSSYKLNPYIELSPFGFLRQ